MIASLRGELVHKGPDGLIVECAGVGYGVTVSIATLSRVGAEGSDLRLLIHTQVGEDVLRLYGFLESTERRVFQVLIGLSGVGPKLAMAVLSTFDPPELAQAVSRGDVRALVSIPGVGKKKAERLRLELKDRLPGTVVGEKVAAAPLLDDLISALENLGFGGSVSEQAARRALEEHPDEEDVAVLVRAALQATTRK